MSLSHERALVCTDPELSRLFETPRGSAVDMVVGAVLAAAALDGSVLLGPLQLLVAGAGMGLYAIDGRVRQPGQNAKRPRGFLPNDKIPEAARVGAPYLPAALTSAMTLFGTQTNRELYSIALAAAKSLSPERFAVIERLAHGGPKAFADAPLAEEFCALLGPMEGGILSPADLLPEMPQPIAGATESFGTRVLATLPWEDGNGRDVQIVCATDAKGTLAVAVYEKAEGLTLAPLGLVAPFHAVPVKRGETRVAAGTILPASGSIGVVQGTRGWEIALGVVRNSLGRSALNSFMTSLAEVRTPEEAISHVDGGGRWVGTVCGTRSARAFTVAR